MKHKIRQKDELVLIVLRIPISLRRKLKVAAAYENSSMNDKARKYIERGLKREGKKIENKEAN